MTISRLRIILLLFTPGVNRYQASNGLPVEVIFRTKKLETCYMDHLEGQRTWGPEVGRKYIQRIDLLQESADMAEVRKLPGLDCHPLKGGRRGQFGITLHGRWRLIFSLQGEKARIIRVEEVSKHYGD